MDDQNIAFRQIIEERNEQDRKWGVQDHSDQDWLCILMEEIGELSECICKSKIGPIKLEEQKEYDKKIDIEMVQVAAVVVAWMENRSRNEIREKDAEKERFIAKDWINEIVNVSKPYNFIGQVLAISKEDNSIYFTVRDLQSRRVLNVKKKDTKKFKFEIN